MEHRRDEERRQADIVCQYAVPQSPMQMMIPTRPGFYCEYQPTRVRNARRERGKIPKRPQDGGNMTGLEGSAATMQLCAPVCVP